MVPQLKHEHYEWLHKHFGQCMRRLARVRERFASGHATAGPEYDRLLEDAYNAVHRLTIASHYRSCRGESPVAGAPVIPRW